MGNVVFGGIRQKIYILDNPPKIVRKPNQLQKVIKIKISRAPLFTFFLLCPTCLTKITNTLEIE